MALQWYRDLDNFVKFKCKVLHIITSSFVKNLHLECLRKISMIIGNGYCLRLMTLLNYGKLLIQRTLPSFLGIMNEGDAHSFSFCAARTPILTRWSSSIFESIQMDSRYRVWSRMYRLGIWINVNVYLFVWINSKSSIKYPIVFL